MLGREDGIYQHYLKTAIHRLSLLHSSHTRARIGTVDQTTCDDNLSLISSGIFPFFHVRNPSNFAKPWKKQAIQFFWPSASIDREVEVFCFLKLFCTLYSVLFNEIPALQVSLSNVHFRALATHVKYNFFCIRPWSGWTNGISSREEKNCFIRWSRIKNVQWTGKEFHGFQSFH